MSFLKNLSPAFTPPHLEGKPTLTVLREKTIQAIFLLLTIGILAFFAVSLNDLLQKQAYMALGALTVITLSVLVLFLTRQSPYSLRCSVILLGILGYAGYSFYRYGLSGDALAFFIVFSVFSILLASTRLGYATILINLAVMGGLSYLVSTGQLHPASGEAFPNNISEWINAGLVFTILNLLVVGVSGYIFGNLQQAFTKSADLARELGKERFTLQSRVEQRTKDLQQRLNQIRVASEISRAISSVLDPQMLYQTVVDLIHDRFDLYYTGLFIVDRSGFAVLTAGTGEAGRKMISSGHRLAVGSASMIGWCIANRSPRIALDTGEEAVRFNNPYLPNTRSEMAVPIISKGEALGALTIQSDQSNAFSEADILILQSVADSLAVAMENARLFQQTQEHMEEIRALNKNYLQQAWSDVLDEYGELSCLVENPSASSNAKTHPIYIPIALRDQILGTLTLETESDELTPEEKSFVEAVTVQTALALENARLVQETQRRVQQEQTLNDLTADFSKVFSIEELLRSALSGISQLPSVAQVSVHLVPPETSPETPFVTAANGKEPA